MSREMLRWMCLDYFYFREHKPRIEHYKTKKHGCPLLTEIAFIKHGSDFIVVAVVLIIVDQH